MPYISKDKRILLTVDRPVTPGELNYKITLLLNEYLLTKGRTYTSINDILGALEGAKLEFYRRIAVPYEDMKKEQNGDVYPNYHQT